MSDSISRSPAATPALTLITDSSRFSGESLFHHVEQALCGGVDAVLVREKSLTSAKLLALASRLRQMTLAHQARLIIHSQADIAAAVGADGVHLASAGITSVAAIRQWLRAPEMSVSVSCHDACELALAHEMGADFAMLSPVFPTDSHPGAPHMGVELFEELVSDAKLPVIALGGITLENCSLLLGRALAVIGAILAADDAEHAAVQLFNTASARIRES
ncbi:MAG: thiamine phosphate synthase [Mariprofundus sp.]|nr:thiamine phosphate synthase [Mariprofundus sp.]